MAIFEVILRFGKVCVGADRRVRPHRMALLFWMSFAWRILNGPLARWMPHVRAEVAGIH